MSFEIELKKLIIEAVAEGVRQGFSQLNLPLAAATQEPQEKTPKTAAKKVKVEPTIKVTVETAEPTIQIVEAEKVEPKVEVKPTAAPVVKAEPKVAVKDTDLDFIKYREKLIGTVKDFKYADSLKDDPKGKQTEANRIIAKILDRVQPGAKANVEILPENRQAVIDLLVAYKDKGEEIFANDASDDGII